MKIDKRGAVYLGDEGYLAGEKSGAGVVSYVPGHVGKCSDLADLVSRWEAFKLASPSYEAVLHPYQGKGESPLFDAQRNVHAVCENDILTKFREKFGKNEEQSRRAKSTNERRRVDE
mgnify:CR=1 FL=1